MITRPRIPLMAKVLGWLSLHLLILALAFAGFVGWQLGLGLDSLLSGSAGDRLRGFGNAARDEILFRPKSEWNEAIGPLAQGRNVAAGIYDFSNPASFPAKIPANVLERARTSLPPPPGPPVRRRPPGGSGRPPHPRGPSDEAGPPPFGEWEARGPVDETLSNDKRPPRLQGFLPPSRPVFLMRGTGGDGYWAGLQLTLPGGPPGQPRRHELLLVRASGLDGSGMFFEFRPWLWGGLAVLALSLAFWGPFVWGITRYLRGLAAATDLIAAGQFKIALPADRNDELGSLGMAIKSMAVRLDHLVSGQKRFLGDAAHELCGPLARLRTGLGILEMKSEGESSAYIANIETDAQELATLVEEILAFSRAGSRVVRRQTVFVAPLAAEVAARESGTRAPEIHIPSDLTVNADAILLGRALGNLVRNSRIHGGADAKVVISAVKKPDYVEIAVTDDGPGIRADELPHLFEPFYRPDRSRSRDTGGSGLGLSIVRSAVEACGGETSASLPPAGGFSVTIRFPS